MKKITHNPYGFKTIAVTIAAASIFALAGCTNNDNKTNPNETSTPTEIVPADLGGVGYVNHVEETALIAGSTTEIITSSKFVPLIPRDGLTLEHKWDTVSNENLTFGKAPTEEGDITEMPSGFSIIDKEQPGVIVLKNESGENATIKITYK